MHDLLSYILDNYPYSSSYVHKSNMYDINWYPISHKKLGEMLCPHCDLYKGNKLYRNNYKCHNCSAHFKVCNYCKSYYILKNDNKKISHKNEIYNKMIKFLKLNKSLVNIIYIYSQSDYYYFNNINNSSYCPRC